MEDATNDVKTDGQSVDAAQAADAKDQTAVSQPDTGKNGVVLKDGQTAADATVP